MSPLEQVKHFRGRSMILKKIFFENWTSRGINRGITQFYTQFTHVSRQCWALKKEFYFKFLSFMCFYFFALFFIVTVWTTIEVLTQIWDHIFQTVFPILFFLFSIQSSKLSKNMRKLPVKLRNATIYPPWGPIFKNSFFLKHTPPSSEMLDLLRRWHLNRIDEKNQGYF